MHMSSPRVGTDSHLENRKDKKMSKKVDVGDVLGILLLGFLVGIVSGGVICGVAISNEKWEDSCIVSETVHRAGVEVHCQFGNRQVILVSQRGEYLALVANTLPGQRSEIPTVCRHTEWGWSCRVGEENDAFYNFSPVRLPSSAEES